MLAEFRFVSPNKTNRSCTIYLGDLWPKSQCSQESFQDVLSSGLWNIDTYTYILSYKTHPETERNPRHVWKWEWLWLLRMGLHVLYLGDWSVELSFWKDLYRTHDFNKSIRKTWRFFYSSPRYFKKIWRYSMSARCQWRTLPALWSWWIAVLPSSPIKWNKAQKNATSSKSKSGFEHQKSDISIFASGLVGLRQVLPSFPWLMGITGYLSQHSNKNQGARSQQEGHIRERWCLWGAWGECFQCLVVGCKHM